MFWEGRSIDPMVNRRGALHAIGVNLRVPECPKQPGRGHFCLYLCGGSGL
jgi:hypothetical protein